MSSTARLIADSESAAGMFNRSNELFLREEPFLRMLALERKRTERSRRRFVLMLMEADRVLKGKPEGGTSAKIARVLFQSTRETDIKGWYRAGSVIGVIFTEVGAADGASITNALLTRITNALGCTLSIEQINEIRLSFHVFPEDWEHTGSGLPADSVLYPELRKPPDSERSGRIIKRAIDVVGSLLALVAFLPLFLVITALIKLTSKGPVLFRQQRVGQHGRPFTFLKFRSMHVANDPTIHEEYVKRLIQGDRSPADEPAQCIVYKLTSDPRVTPIGRFLRRSSLDELPQFLNVLSGDMSLVGPRPAIPYEFRCYDLWHRRRVLAAKPGITGLWQVEGRCRVAFDEMVRLDLRYASSRSLWLDLKILFRTPAAVFSGKGAY